jgi:integrase
VIPVILDSRDQPVDPQIHNERYQEGDGDDVKKIPATQAALDALPLDSGMWRIEGVPGLYVRSRRQSKSFLLVRRINTKLVRETLGELSMKQAKERAFRLWGALKPKPAAGDVVTFAVAFEAYVLDKEDRLADATKENYRLNFDNHLSEWSGKRSLHEIGADRPGVRLFQRQLRQKHGPAKSNQCMRLLSAVYNWQRKIDPTLPESPTAAIDLDQIEARDWAYSDVELRSWWYAIEEKKIQGRMTERVERGVKTLTNAVKRAWWLTALFTGARPRSIENLAWADLDFDRKTVRFRVTKADRPYTVPMSDVLHQVLIAYRDDSKVPPSDWVFPSDRRDGHHLVNVKDEKSGVSPKYHLRHTFKTRLTGLGFTTEQAKLLMGHSLGGDVSTGYVTAPLLIESLRPVVNALATHYLEVMGVDVAELVGRF